MTTSQVLLTAWTWEPSVLLGCAALLAVYMWAVRGRLTGRSLLFLVGVLVLALALLSPIDTLGDGYLFSAHMIQHLLLVLVAAPLLLMGVPTEVYERALAHKPVRSVERVLGNPLLAWFLMTATLWVWHIPALYDGALRNEGVHIFQHMTFLAAAAIFWWPIVTPVPEHRMHAVVGIAYLFTQGVSNTVLGIWLTFAPAGLYPFYLNPPDVLGILPPIRQQWGLTPEADQAFGGLFMWAPSGVIYLGAILGTLARWFAEPDSDEIEADQAEALRSVSNS
jgi:cytochrome c oxidase assembly factor CtaG